MGKVARHQERVDHIVPAEELHDGLNRVGLQVLRGRTGQVKGEQGETWKEKQTSPERS